jgi:CrcB protein
VVTLRELLLVALGGALGSVGRYLTGGWVQRHWSGHWSGQGFGAVTTGGALAALPVGTLVVNMLGSLAIGLVAGLVEFRQVPGPDLRLLLVVGLLGGYTTFSAFSLETLVLLRAGQAGLAFLNGGLQLTLGLAAAWAGFLLGRWL